MEGENPLGGRGSEKKDAKILDPGRGKDQGDRDREKKKKKKTGNRTSWDPKGGARKQPLSRESEQEHGFTRTMPGTWRSEGTPPNAEPGAAKRAVPVGELPHGIRHSPDANPEGTSSPSESPHLGCQVTLASGERRTSTHAEGKTEADGMTDRGGGAKRAAVPSSEKKDLDSPRWPGGDSYKKPEPAFDGKTPPQRTKRLHQKDRVPSLCGGQGWNTIKKCPFPVRTLHGAPPFLKAYLQEERV